MDTTRAYIKLQKISPRKAQLVANLFRNKSIADALAILNNTQKKSSKIFIKLLNSAIANAVNNHGMSTEKLFVAKVIVNKGPTLKRFQPRSQGRAYSIFKRTSCMTIEVAER